MKPLGFIALVSISTAVLLLIFVPSSRAGFRDALQYREPPRISHLEITVDSSRHIACYRAGDAMFCVALDSTNSHAR